MMEWIRLNEFWYAVAATISVLGTGIMSVFFLESKYKRDVNILVWGGGSLIYGISIYLLFTASQPAYYDFYLFLGWMVIIPAATILLNKESTATKIFVAVSGVFISNVCSFISGSTTSLWIRNVAPWGEDGYTFIMPFAGVKLLVTSAVTVLLVFFLREQVREVFSILDGKMERFIPIPLVAGIGFFCIVTIVQKYGVVVSEGIYFAGFFIIICGTFALLYWLVFSNVLWSAKVMRTEAELNVASNIQKDMLPCIFPPFPGYEEFDILASMQPAKEVGGDFYDFFLIDEDHIAVVIADVSGKGVPAALFMVIAKTLIKNHALAKETPEEIFTYVNNQLCENNEENLFVTAWMGILEISTGLFTYVNAGHNPPLLKRGTGDFEYLRSKPGFVLAGMEDMKYKQTQMTLNEGDVLFLYTDGVTEAMDKQHHLYGDDRLKQLMNQKVGWNFGDILTTVKSDIDTFVNGAPQFDDITMLALKMNIKDRSSQL